MPTDSVPPISLSITRSLSFPWFYLFSAYLIIHASIKYIKRTFSPVLSFVFVSVSFCFAPFLNSYQTFFFSPLPVFILLLLSQSFFFFMNIFSLVWSSASCITHFSQPDCQPVWRWQLKIVLVRLQHPTVPSGCQVPCCHGNYAEMSGCPVDIYRVEKAHFESRPCDRAWLSFMVVAVNSEGWLVGLM